MAPGMLSAAFQGGRGALPGQGHADLRGVAGWSLFAEVQQIGMESYGWAHDVILHEAGGSLIHEKLSACEALGVLAARTMPATVRREGKLGFKPLAYKPASRLVMGMDLGKESSKTVSIVGHMDGGVFRVTGFEEMPESPGVKGRHVQTGKIDWVSVPLPGEPGKPESAWKPLAECDGIGQFLVRNTCQRASVRACWRTRKALGATWDLPVEFSRLKPIHLEFCPVPA
jgi:hypothetical protein